MSESEPPRPTDDESAELSIEELAQRGGVSVRTVRFYIAEGLLPGPGSRGKAATYGDEQLLRLRLIRRLAEQRVPLAQTRAMLAGLSLDEARALLADEDRRAAELEQAAQAPSPKAYVASLLERARAARGGGVEPTSRPADFRPSYPAASPQRAPAGPSAAPSPEPAPTWRRWELAPGVELHVRSDVEQRFRTLIERLLRAAGAAGSDPGR